jgi:TatD DNase family protein
MTKKFVDAGYYFTLGGVITFSRDYDATVATIPMDRILMETDAPYVAPMPQPSRSASTAPT